MSIQSSLSCVEQATSKGANVEQTITFSAVLHRWLSCNRLRLKPPTYAKYYEQITNHIVPNMGNMPINELSTSDINSYLNKKSQTGRLENNDGLSSSSLRIQISIIHSALNFAILEGYRSNSDVVINYPQKIKSEVEIFDSSEQTVLERYLFQDMDSTKIGVLISLYLGLRIGEICGLMWTDIDFEKNTLIVRRTVERIKNLSEEKGVPKTVLIVGEPKTVTSKRKLPIPDFLIPLLKKLKSSSQCEYVISIENSTSFVDPRTFQYRYKKYLSDCAIKNKKFHALRHTFATRCVEAGMDIKTLSEILGHANVNITLNIYVHPSLQQKEIQLRKLCVYQGRTTS